MIDSKMKGLVTAGMLLVMASCGGDSGLNIRPIPGGLAAGDQAVPFRIAEARGHFALGNVALALEGFRKALREDPSSVDALAGLAECYDRMGRFDLSRRHYETALAIAPGDHRLYAGLAGSLTLQGRTEEAQALRGELAQRIASETAPTLAATVPAAPPIIEAEAPSAPAQVPVPPAKRSVTLDVPGSPPAIVAKSQVVVALSPPRAPVAAATVAMPAPERAQQAAPLPLAHASAATGSAPPPAAAMARAPVARLERLSLGEVALLTSAAPIWRPRLVERSARSATIRYIPLRRTAQAGPVLLLNAARTAGLAARTRIVLARRGWSGIRVGNARHTLRASTILYPASRRVNAEQLARQFGFALRHRPSSNGALTILLGRDAASNRLLRAKRG